MSVADVHRVAVVGAGTMGSGIGQVFAQAGYGVTLYDVSTAAVNRAVQTVQSSLNRFVEKQKLDAAERDTIMARISPTTSFELLSHADFVVEAVSESLAIKQDVFRSLDQITRPGCVLASNTSSISITKLAAQTRRPEFVLGMHFMNPVPLMTLVEIIRGEMTAPYALALAKALCERLGKTAVEAADYPGFISNRVLMPMINEAMFAVMEGVGTPDAIDTVMRLGMNHPMGPLTLADFIGLDVCLSILNVLYEGFGDPKYRPCPLLRRMVDAGQLGRKSGRGFYEYKK